MYRLEVLVPEHIETGRLVLLKEICHRLKGEMEHLMQPRCTTCRAQCGLEWNQTCGSAMLGALHRMLLRRKLECHGLQEWYDKTAEQLAAGVFFSVSTMVSKLEQLRLATVEDPGMRRWDVHRHCTPWERLTLQKILRMHEVETLVPIDEKYFKSQAAKSGLQKDGLLSDDAAFSAA
jgi:hypothetical protein